MPRLAVLRPPASSDVSVEVGNVSTVVLGNERPVVTNPAEQLGATIAYKVGQVELAIVVAVITFTLIILIYNLELITHFASRMNHQVALPVAQSYWQKPW